MSESDRIDWARLWFSDWLLHEFGSTWYRECYLKHFQKVDADYVGAFEAMDASQLQHTINRINIKWTDTNIVQFISALFHRFPSILGKNKKLAHCLQFWEPSECINYTSATPSAHTSNTSNSSHYRCNSSNSSNCSNSSNNSNSSNSLFGSFSSHDDASLVSGNKCAVRKNHKHYKHDKHVKHSSAIAPGLRQSVEKSRIGVFGSLSKNGSQSKDVVRCDKCDGKMKLKDVQDCYGREGCHCNLCGTTMAAGKVYNCLCEQDGWDVCLRCAESSIKLDYIHVDHSLFDRDIKSGESWNRREKELIGEIWDHLKKDYFDGKIDKARCGRLVRNKMKRIGAQKNFKYERSETGVKNRMIQMKLFEYSIDSNKFDSRKRRTPSCESDATKSQTTSAESAELHGDKDEITNNYSGSGGCGGDSNFSLDCLDRGIDSLSDQPPQKKRKLNDSSSNNNEARFENMNRSYGNVSDENMNLMDTNRNDDKLKSLSPTSSVANTSIATNGLHSYTSNTSNALNTSNGIDMDPYSQMGHLGQVADVFDMNTHAPISTTSIFGPYGTSESSINFGVSTQETDSLVKTENSLNYDSLQTYRSFGLQQGQPSYMRQNELTGSPMMPVMELDGHMHSSRMSDTSDVPIMQSFGQDGDFFLSTQYDDTIMNSFDPPPPPPAPQAMQQRDQNGMDMGHIPDEQSNTFLT